MVATIDDVARMARVSKTTVSRFLNGKLEHMGEATRKRVGDAIEELHYRPSILASGLRTKHTLSIGLVVSNVRNPFFAHLVHEVERSAYRAKHNVILCTTADDPDVERDSINSLLTRQVGGLIVTTSGGNRDLFARLTQRGFPIVLVDRSAHDVEADLVGLDNHQATHLAMRHLADLGHTRIGILTASPIELTPRIERVDAYHQAVRAFGLEADPQLVWVGAGTREGGGAGARALLSLPRAPTALLSSLNVLTLGVLEECQRAGHRIPDDVSIVSFDDVDWTSVVTPPLTVVAQPVTRFAEIAVERLFMRMRSTERPAPKQCRLPGTLIVRASTAQPAPSPGGVR